MKINRLKYYIAFATAALAGGLNSAYAVEPGDSIVRIISYVDGADKVTVTENTEGVTIDLQGIGGKADSTFTYHKDYAPGTIVRTKQTDNNWLLSSPFSRSSERTRPRRWTVYSAGLAFGLTIPTGVADGVKFKTSGSLELMWTDVIGLQYDLTSTDAFRVGIGIDWRNYKLDDDYRFYKSNDGKLEIEKYENPDSWKRSSRLKTFSLMVPVMYKKELGSDFSISAGVVLDFNTYASIKTKYNIGDTKHEESDKGIHHNTVTYDFMAIVSWRGLGLYAKYSPCNVLNTDFAPKFKSFTTGMIFFW